MFLAPLGTIWFRHYPARPPRKMVRMQWYPACVHRMRSSTESVSAPTTGHVPLEKGLSTIEQDRRTADVHDVTVSTSLSAHGQHV